MAFSLKTNALTQVNDVKSIIDIASATTTWDQTFIELINAATEWMQNYCGGRKFGDTTVPTYTNETYDSDDEPGDRGVQRWVYLKAYPVTVFTTVESRTGTTTYTAYETTSYETYAERGAIYLYGGIAKGKKTVRVTYTAGYKIDWTTQANHTLPYDLTLACRKIVLKEFGKRKAQGLTSESVGGARIDWNENLDPEVVEILSRYKRVQV